MNRRWGRDGRHDFWTALSRGEVDTPELRAMELLESVCDPYRFGIYCFSAEMPARGNVTGTNYMIAKRGGVIELDDDLRPKAYWCISIGPHSPVPGTDNVVVLKAMIEGEELEFRRIGNRNSFFGSDWSGSFASFVPHAQPLIPEDQRELAKEIVGEQTSLRDLLQIPASIGAEMEREEVAFEAILEDHSKKMEAAFREAESWVRPERKEKKSGIYVGGEIFGQNYVPIVASVGQDRGVRLGDGTTLTWDENQAEQAELRYGISIHDEVVRMNGEGYNRDVIKWFLQNFFGVRAWGQGELPFVDNSSTVTAGWAVANTGMYV